MKIPVFKGLALPEKVWKPVLIAALCFAAFWPTLRTGFMIDDPFLLRATRRTYSNNILLAQTAPARRAVVAEYTADEVVVREAKPGDDFIAATNHFRKLGRPAEFPEARTRFRAGAVHAGKW